jgi:hypothetical protein
MNATECQRICVDCKNLDECPLLKTIKKHPKGISGKKLAEEVSLPFAEVNFLLLQLCLISQFVLRSS